MVCIEPGQSLLVVTQVHSWCKSSGLSGSGIVPHGMESSYSSLLHPGNDPSHISHTPSDPWSFEMFPLDMACRPSVQPYPDSGQHHMAYKSLVPPCLGMYQLHMGCMMFGLPRSGSVPEHSCYRKCLGNTSLPFHILYMLCWLQMKAKFEPIFAFSFWVRMTFILSSESPIATVLFVSSLLHLPPRPQDSIISQPGFPRSYTVGDYHCSSFKVKGSATWDIRELGLHGVGAQGKRLTLTHIKRSGVFVSTPDKY